MVKNIKRYLKVLIRNYYWTYLEVPYIFLQDLAKDSAALIPRDFVPVTYLLPADYSLFVEEFRYAYAFEFYIFK